MIFGMWAREGGQGRAAAPGGLRSPWQQQQQQGPNVQQAPHSGALQEGPQPGLAGLCGAAHTGGLTCCMNLAEVVGARVSPRADKYTCSSAQGGLVQRPGREAVRGQRPRTQSGGLDLVLEALFAKVMSGWELLCLEQGVWDFRCLRTFMHKPPGAERPVSCSSALGQAHSAAPCPICSHRYER